MTVISDLRDIQLAELEILKDVRDFCDTRGIRYFLCGGTLLGAIRHKGFIPWDDDIDIGMLRPDMERFCREYESDRYVVLSSSKDSSYPYAYPKIVDSRTTVREEGQRYDKMGIWIDICPFEGWEDPDFYPRRDSFLWRTVVKVLNNRNHVLSGFRSNPLQFLKVLAAIPTRLFPNRFWTDRLVRIASRHSPEHSPFIGCLLLGYKPSEILPRSVFDGTAHVTFERETFAAIPDWNRYLTALYGDYMSPPPPEKRHRMHRFVAWLK